MNSLNKTAISTDFPALAGEALPPQTPSRDTEIIRLTGINRSLEIKVQEVAATQSLFATAKLNGIEPAAWLKDALKNFPSGLCDASTNALPI
jgi:hypothetical protein